MTTNEKREGDNPLNVQKTPEQTRAKYIDEQNQKEISKVDPKEIADPSHIDLQRSLEIGPEMSAQQCTELAAQKGLPRTGAFRCDQSGEPGKQEDAQYIREQGQQSTENKKQKEHELEVPSEQWTKYDWE